MSQVNSTEELLAIPHLFQALKRRFSRSHVRLLVLVDHQDSPLGQSYVGLMASTSAFCQSVCWIVRRRTLRAMQLPKIWATMSFSRPPMAAFLGQKGRCACWLSVCSTVACWFYNTCNILKWDLMGLVFVFKVDTSNSKVSWSLMKSHWFSWFNDCQS